MNKKQLKKLSNSELETLLNKAEWCDKALLKEYDERRHDGRIIFKSIGNIKEYFRKRRQENKHKKAS